jgi:hypothetical protein
MVGEDSAASAGLREAIEKLGRASLACDLAGDLATPALKQLETANQAIATAGAILQDIVRGLASKVHP